MTDGDTVKEMSPSVTVMVTVEGGLDKPPSSVTVSDAVYVPGVEYMTCPGLATELESGFPPGNDHEYAVTVPSGSLPVPSKNTESPALTVTSVDGLVIVAVGG